MDFYYTVDEKGYVSNFSTAPSQGCNWIFATFEDSNIDVARIQGYEEYYRKGFPYLRWSQEKYNKYLEDVRKERETQNGKELFSNLAKAYTLDNATDEQAYVMRYLFDEWSPDGVVYTSGNRVVYKDKFYKYIGASSSVSQPSWAPDVAVSLWVEIPNPAEEWPEFKQPTGAHDAYKKGDVVMFKGKKYESLIDANVYSPEAYPAGWKEVN